MDRIICIVGPTASGKTRLSIALAKAFDGEVISCDSMQIYRGMDIGTATPTPEEIGDVPHYMTDVVDPREDFSVGRYVAMADALLTDILARGKTAIIEGGTGLYIDSLILGRTFAPTPRSGHREALEKLAEEYGIEAVLELLENFDPESARKLHPADKKRILRAAEVYLETGKSITQHNLDTQALPPKYHPVWIGLDYADRQMLYERINRRVTEMFEKGLLDEVQALLDSGVPETATAMQALGYKEPVAALAGKMPMDQAMERIRQRTRNFAKRQLTWFRRNRDIHWILQTPDQPFEEVLVQATEILRKNFGE